jgi:EAL domain-containing protein (putative c-di-GMP-specific phosphodiesterase class I)
MANQEYMIKFENMGLNNIGKFYLLAQPIVSLQSYEQDVNKFEFLSRFVGVDEVQIPPQEIFTKYQTKSQLKSLDLIVFEESMRLLNDYNLQLCTNFKASINVSEASIECSNYYFNHIEQLRQRYGVSSKNIALELTERTYSGVREFTKTGLELGYEISVDDFGSENSATGKVVFGVLGSVPDNKFSKVNMKLDRFFVERILNNNSKHHNISKGLLQNFLGFKKDFPEITLIAEGIESMELAEFMHDHKIDFGQGYLWSKPISFDKYMQPVFNSKIKNKFNKR